MKFKLVFLLSFIFSNLSFSQNEYRTSQDSSSWKILKNAAHEISFCIYHSSTNHCTNHSDEFAKREKNTPADEDTYYFEMKKEWAQNRLDKWAKLQKQPVEDFLILFDVGQKSTLEMEEDETINSYLGFVIIDLTKTINFSFLKKNSRELKMTIKSDDEFAMMENFLWREFMSGRLGRFNPAIEFELIGKDAEVGFEKFKEAFLVFQKKNKR